MWETYDPLEEEDDPRSSNLSEKEWIKRLSYNYVKQTKQLKFRDNIEPRRWWILFFYGLASLGSVFNWSLWGPIARPALLVFKKWHPSTIVLLNNWGPLTFFLLTIPTCYLIRTYGIKKTLIISTALSTLGTGLRMLQIERIYSIIAHIAAILNATGGVFLSPCALPIASKWFPISERTTALSVSTTMGMLGIAASYIVGPLIVHYEGETSPTPSTIIVIKSHIMILCFIGFMVELLLLLIMVFLFPEKPHLPPNRSTVLMETVVMREPMYKEFFILLKNVNFVLVAFSVALNGCIVGPWLSLLPLVLNPDYISEEEATDLGFLSVIFSSVTAVVISTLSERCPTRKKVLVFSLKSISFIMFLNILLMQIKIIEFEKAFFFLFVMSGITLVWAIPPLYFDIAAEITYPHHDGTVGGLVMGLNNLLLLIVYIQIQLNSDTGLEWLNYALVIFSFISLILLLLVKVKYNRLGVDNASI